MISAHHAKWRQERNLQRYILIDYFKQYAVIDSYERKIIKTGINKAVLHEQLKALREQKNG